MAGLYIFSSFHLIFIVEVMVKVIFSNYEITFLSNLEDLENWGN